MTKSRGSLSNKSDWTSVVSMGSVVKFLSGGTPSKSEPAFWGGEIPWVSSGEMAQSFISDTSLRVTELGAENGTRRVPANTPLVVVRGMSLATEFRVSIPTREVTFNQDIKALIPTAKLDSKFLYYYLVSQKNAIRDSASEAAHGTKKLDMPVLEDWPIPLPSIDIQRKVVSILSAYDDLIENNKRRIAILEKLAEEIYREWFVRMRFPGHEKVKSTKGIPEGWALKPLGELAEVTSSKRIFLSDYVSEGVPFYRSKEIIEKFENGATSSELYITEEKFTEIESRFGAPVEDDILLTAVGTLGVPYVVRRNERFYFKDGNLIWFRKLNACVNKFIFFWMQTPYGKGALLETTIGSSQQAFTIANLKKIKLLVPTTDVLQGFVQIIEPVLFQKENLLKANSILSTTRDLLLPRLISGKLSLEALGIDTVSTKTEIKNLQAQREAVHA